MSSLLIVSPSPHIHTQQKTQRIMLDVILALTPALGVSLYVFGIGALKVTLLAVLSCVFFEYVIQKYLLKENPTVTDGSAILTGLLLAFNLPSNLPVGIIIFGSLIAIGVAKMSFGGLGKNPFNPALVGRVFLLISFPVQMTSWPEPMTNRFQLDAVTSATPLAILDEGLKNGESVSVIMERLPSYMQSFLGLQGGSLGEISAIALLLGLVYLLIRRVITWHIPIAVLGTIALFTGALWGINPDGYADPMFHILSGGVMLGAIYMATDYVTSPMYKKGMIIFGVSIGVITVLIRVFGSFPEGISFAILIMNAFVPLINKYVKPKRFGAKRNG
jgi:Na+-translocating ferredoxin:NAD+ oxidoreductase subunit D